MIYCFNSNNFEESQVMRKLIILFCLIGSSLIILDSFNFAHSIMMFLLAGVIPGTNFALSPIDMMAASATAITLILLKIALGPNFPASVIKSMSAPTQKTKKLQKTT